MAYPQKKRGGDALALFAALFYLFTLMFFMLEKNSLEHQKITLPWITLLSKLLPSTLLGTFFLVLFLLYPKNPRKVTRFAMQSWVALCFFYILFFVPNIEQTIVFFFFCLLGLVFLFTCYIQAVQIEGGTLPF